ncbi:hypothetical protein LCGC14_1590960 [marine sediment metagenome]|uniref:Metallo-beta-lactamase domain-containing protein n=1 Tax=marine sediment metagenome TaxID=412755 RepID=A0A0F9LEF9_9ZZZZ
MSNLRIICWDVEHGNAAYIKTPADKHIALDIGSSASFSPLKSLRDDFNLEFLNEVIITHPHSDHMSDIFEFDLMFPKVLNRSKHLTEEDIRNANRAEESNIVNKYLEIHGRYNQPIKKEDNPELPENNGGVYVRTFVDKSSSTSNINNHCTVVVIEYLNVKTLFPGDIEAPAWEALLQQENFVEAIAGVDILVASHHGRESGYYTDLFDHFTPKLTIISDGRFNDTSATSRYTDKSSGWKVNHRDESNESETRYCISTRNDGHIDIEVGESQNNSTYLTVTID